MSRSERTSALLALALVVGGCSRGGPVQIGAVLPLTGPTAVYGKAIQKGLELAAEQLKQDPEAPRFELVMVDSGGDPKRAHEALDQLYGDGAAVAIGGVTSAEALAMVEIADDHDRVLLSPSASQPQLSGISSNFFRIFPSDFAEGTTMARYAVDKLRLKTGVVIAKQETYAKGVQQVFAEEFQAKGGNILESIEFPPGTAEFGAFAERVAVLKPDFVYIAAYAPETARLIVELRRQGFEGLLLTTSSFAAAETIESIRREAEGTYFTQTSFDTEGSRIAPVVKAFVDAFRSRYGQVPDLYAAHGYDALRIVAEAMRQGGDSPSSFWKGMRGIREYPGVTGTLQFDDKGDVQKFPHVYIVRSGKAVDVELERQQEIDRARDELRKLQEEIERLQRQGN